MGHQEIIYLTGQKQESAFIQEGAPYLVYLIPLKTITKVQCKFLCEGICTMHMYIMYFRPFPPGGGGYHNNQNYYSQYYNQYYRGWAQSQGWGQSYAQGYGGYGGYGGYAPGVEGYGQEQQETEVCIA